MAKPGGLRKLGLAGALLGTFYASFVAGDGQTYQTTPPPAPAVASERKPATVLTAQADAVLADEAGEDEGTDPFAPRNWMPPPPPEPPKPAAPAALVAAAPAPPPGPPALPFKFAGRLNDGDDQVIYLAHGDQALIARSGEVLENVYKVLSIDVSQIEFEHLPTGQKQVLPLPGREN